MLCATLKLVARCATLFSKLTQSQELTKLTQSQARNLKEGGKIALAVDSHALVYNWT